MEQQIFKTINEVMKKINAIGKDSFNDNQNFKYRGIDDVMNELHPAMAECGLFVVPEVLTEERTEKPTKSGGLLFYTRQKIKFTFYALDGSNLSAVVMGEGMDSGDKASNKALSIGLKYALLQVLCIPTEDEKDPDGQSHELKAPVIKQDDKQIQNMVNVIKKALNEGVISDEKQIVEAENYINRADIKGITMVYNWLTGGTK